MILSLYRIPNLRFKGYSVYTNITPAGAYRGFGNPQGNITVERGIEMMAARLGMDPLELRRQNHTRKGDEYVPPYPCDSRPKTVGWATQRSSSMARGDVICPACSRSRNKTAT